MCYTDHPVRTLSVKLPNGKECLIQLNPVKIAETVTVSKSTDKVQAYAKLLLELGLLFKNFTESIKVPNRPRMLRTLKLMMILLKADNNLSKYADEIMRFLIHQICLLSAHDARMSFYSMFINTQGRLDTHIAADMQMEFLVRTYKKHIKHMLSNKTESNIERKTAALGGLCTVTTHYDEITSVVVRTQNHSKPSEMGDEISMIEDLRKIHPFQHTENRSHETFTNVQPSLLTGLNNKPILDWLTNRSLIHAQSLGN